MKNQIVGILAKYSVGVSGKVCKYSVKQACVERQHQTENHSATSGKGNRIVVVWKKDAS